MRTTVAILALLFFLAPIALNASGGTYTVAQANQSITNATAYVNSINESAYLIFYPNLTQAYSYLNRSKIVLNSSPASAVAYSNMAVASARSSYEKISAYREVSLIGIVLFTVVVGIILYRFMQPRRRR